MTGMQTAEHIHSIRIPFELEVSPGKALARFVYIYPIFGTKVCLVDTGVSGSSESIFNYLTEMGRHPSEIETVVLTHAHADHMGSAFELQRSTGCKIAAHVGDVPWIEDTGLQYRERPVPGFHSIVGTPVKVDLPLQDGDTIELGEDSVLRVIHTQGHSKGHISLYYPQDGALLTGDSVPVPGELPIYEDAIAAVKSIKRQRGIKPLRVLLSAWAEPVYGDRTYQVMDEAVHYIQVVHEEVLKVKAELGSGDVKTVAQQVGAGLKLSKTALNPLFFKTIEAHLNASDYPDLLVW